MSWKVLRQAKCSDLLHDQDLKIVETVLWLGVVAYSCNPSYWEAVVWEKSANHRQIRTFRELRGVRDTFLVLWRNARSNAQISATGGVRVKRRQSDNSPRETDRQDQYEKRENWNGIYCECSPSRRPSLKLSTSWDSSRAERSICPGWRGGVTRPHNNILCDSKLTIILSSSFSPTWNVYNFEC